VVEPQITENATSDPRPPARILAGGLELRRWQPDDLQALQRSVAESINELHSWLAWASSDVGSQRSFLQSTSQAWDQGERFEYAIRTGDALVGGAGLMRRIGPGGLEIGYWVHSRHTGRGIAKLASAALTDAAFRLPWVDRVEIHHDQANGASRGVPSGLGFELAGTARQVPRAPRETGVDLIWRLGRDSFPAGPAQDLLERAARP